MFFKTLYGLFISVTSRPLQSWGLNEIAKLGAITVVSASGPPYSCPHLAHIYHHIAAYTPSGQPWAQERNACPQPQGMKQGYSELGVAIQCSLTVVGFKVTFDQLLLTKGKDFWRFLGKILLHEKNDEPWMWLGVWGWDACLCSSQYSEKLVTTERKVSYLCGPPEDMTLGVWRTWGKSVGIKSCCLWGFVWLSLSKSKILTWDPKERLEWFKIHLWVGLHIVGGDQGHVWESSDRCFPAWDGSFPLTYSSPPFPSSPSQP